MKELNKTKERMLRLLKVREDMTVGEFVDILDLSRQIIHRYLKELLEEKIIIKKGTSPKVYYSINEKSPENENLYDFDILSEIKKVIDENFLLIKPTGFKISGLPAFIIWCKKRNVDVKQKAQEYYTLFKKYESLKKNNLLSGKQKIVTSLENVYLEDIFYIDFYAWEIFGKTKLGQLLIYAKQSQNTKIMGELIKLIKPTIIDLIEREGIDAVGFVPPTVKREIQFMKILEKKLRLNLPIIEINKIKTDIAVPQKTLSKLEDRIENANATIIVTEKRKGFKKILLLDDAVGSGATLNAIAHKIKKSEISNNVLGLAVTGSLKGFDVISEV